MHSIQIRTAFFDQDEPDTAVDIRTALARRPRLRSVSPDSPDIPEPAPEQTPEGPARSPIHHATAQRLDRLQRLEAVSRRGVRSLDAVDPELPRPPGIPARVDYARSMDPGVRVRRKGSDTIEIRGSARGGGVSSRPSGLAVAVEARVFRVDAHEGQSAKELARRLAVALGPHYRTLVISESDDQAYIRISERFPASSR